MAEKIIYLAFVAWVMVPPARCLERLRRQEAAWRASLPPHLRHWFEIEEWWMTRG